MRTSRFFGVLGAVPTFALLNACGGLPHATPIGSATAARQTSGNKTFFYTGGEQMWSVPPRVRRITIVARGAAGDGYSYGKSQARRGYFGKGGRVYATVPVKPGEALYIFVGGQGAFDGAFNGGGKPGAGGEYGGGGASDVREGAPSLTHRIVVAAGGGGQGYAQCRDCHRASPGGRGGGAVGGAGVGDYGSGGGGGTQSDGGAGGAGIAGGSAGKSGTAGSAGTLVRGGNGGNGGVNYASHSGGGGGGGGGGYFGGGGGGGGAAEEGSIYGLPGGGGGGGSSYVESTAIKAHIWAGWKNAVGNGLIVLSWTE